MARTYPGAEKQPHKAVPRTPNGVAYLTVADQLAAVEHTQDNPDVAHHWAAIRKQVATAEAALHRADPSLIAA